MARADSICEAMTRQAGLPLISNLQKAELRGLTVYITDRMAAVARLVKE
jgi:hypothetical protein